MPLSKNYLVAVLMIVVAALAGYGQKSFSGRGFKFEAPYDWDETRREDLFVQHVDRDPYHDKYLWVLGPLTIKDSPASRLDWMKARHGSDPDAFCSEDKFDRKLPGYRLRCTRIGRRRDAKTEYYLVTYLLASPIKDGQAATYVMEFTGNVDWSRDLYFMDKIAKTLELKTSTGR